MSENKFWLGIFGIIGAVILGITFLSQNYYKSLDQKVVDMVKNGASPIEASCALSDPYGNPPACIAIIARK